MPFSLISVGFFAGFRWFLLVSACFLLFSVDLLRISVGFRVFRWFLLVFACFRWSVGFPLVRWFSRGFVGFRVVSWVFVGFVGFAWFRGFRVVSWVSRGFVGFAWFPSFSRVFKVVCVFPTHPTGAINKFGDLMARPAASHPTGQSTNSVI